MPIDRNLVDSAVGSGQAFDLLNRLGPGPWTSQADIDAVIRRFGGPSRVDRDTALEIISQYTAFRETGTRLGNATTNRPQKASSIPAIAGCDNAFEYQVAFSLTDTISGRTFIKQFLVGSNRPLGRFDVLGLARIPLNQFLEKLDTSLSGSGNETNFVVNDSGQITGAGRCV